MDEAGKSISSQTSTALEVPVTEDDLRNFHQSHFSSGHDTDASVTQHGQAEDFYEDDQLGYYSDGVKRTLTDDQIAMFRHSEIQTILRERRHRLENADSDDEGASSESHHQPRAVLNDGPPDLKSNLQGVPPNRDAGQPTKRKWTEFVRPSEDNPDSLTHRRLARELDEVMTSSVDLLYGEEEPSVPALPKARAQHDGPGGRKKVSYDQSDISDFAEERMSGKGPVASKFVWPSLGVTKT